MVDESQLLAVLREKLPLLRYTHTLGVADTAEKMALKAGLSVKKARLAGLLHDCAKGIEGDELYSLALKSGWEIDALEFKIPQVLHAPAGAYLAREEWGVEDQEILEAIRFHTIGSPEMKWLARIIFVADFIEPNRKFPGLAQIRLAADRNFEEAIVSICNHSIRYNIELNRLIHPNTLLLRNDIIGGC